jgi:hypothetical protein
MDIVKFIETNTPFVFAKFGDGEYFAAIRTEGGNCDGTQYTEKLGNGIIDAFKYLSQFPNVYIGKWCDFDRVAEYFKNLVPHTVTWENYNIFIFRTRNEFYDRCIPMYKAIRNAKQQKIYVCNPTMVEGARHLLKVDAFVPIHPTNWFDTAYTEVLDAVKSQVQDPNNLLILTSAGMGAKVLIADLHRLYPNAIILDIGSAMDLICSSRRTRDYHQLNGNEIMEIRQTLLSL